MFSLQQIIRERNKRLDGFTHAQAEVICSFQREIERDIQSALSSQEISYAESTIHYDAMRTALYRARVGDIPVTYESLLETYLSALSIIRQ